MCYSFGMSKFFTPNLERNGRILRAIGGLCLLAGGVIALFYIRSESRGFKRSGRSLNVFVDDR